MKRILSLFIILVLALGMLASCEFPELPFLPTTSNEAEADISEAITWLDDMYKDDEGTSTVNGLELVANVTIGKTVFTVVWSADTDLVEFNYSEDDGVYIVSFPEDLEESVNYTLTASVTSPAGQSDSVSYARILPPGGYGVISEPEVDVAYKFALLHGNEKAVVYFDGNNYNNYAWYLAYSQDPLAAVDVYLETVEGVEGGYRLYFNKDGEKTYIRAYPRDGDTTKGTLEMTTTVPEEYYTFDSEYHTLIYTSTTGEQFYLGSSGTYKSISLSAISYIDGETSYIAHLYGAGGYTQVLPEQVLPEVPENYTDKDLVEALYKLASGQTLEGPYELTGVITSIKYAYDPGYNNISVVIVVDGMTDKPVLCYRLNGGEELKVGDTITVFAGLTNYGGTYETTSGGLIREVIPGTGETPTPPAGDNDSVVLDLTGNANLVSDSAEKNVFAANGITLTNDKASSSSDLTVQASFAQRFYAGSTITIEYPGMTKIVLDLDDYSEGKYLKGFDNMTVEGATITRENDIVTIIFDEATDSFTSGAFATQVRCEKIEVFTGDVEQPPVGGDDPVTPPAPAYPAPVAGEGYKLFIEQTTLGKKIYFNGTINADGRMLTTDDESAAVSIYFEEVTGGYHIYYFNGDVKTYIADAPYLNDKGYIKCRLAATTEAPSTVWTYDTALGIIEMAVTFEGKSDTFFAGTYSDYNTISLSGAYYKDQISSGTQFPARIELVEGGDVIDPPVHEHNFVDGKCSCGETDPNYQPPEHEHEFVDGKCSCGETDPNYVPPVDDGVMTIPEVLASAEGTAVVVKGTVCDIYQSWNTQYNNMSFYISDDAGNKLLVFRTGTKVNIGDQVTVTGKATVYNSVIQIAQGGTTVIDVAHVCSEFTEGSCTVSSTCVVCGKLGTEAPGHSYENGVCSACGAAEPTGDVLPGNLVFTGLVNKASADTYLKTNYPEWTITGKLGNGYGDYLGFGRSGDNNSAITSSTISTSTAFTVVTVLKGNGSNGVATSTLTFTLVDKDGNVVATGYADGSTTASITPVDAKDTTYTISFTFVEGKTWTDVSNLVITFAKATGNIGMKSLDFVK